MRCIKFLFLCVVCVPLCAPVSGIDFNPVSLYKKYKAATAYQNNDAQDAANIFDSLTSNNEAATFYNAGKALYKDQQFQKAADYFAHAADLSGKNNQLKIQAYYDRGNALTQDKEWQRAMESYQKVLEYDAEHVHAKEMIEKIKKKLEQEKQENEKQQQDKEKKEQEKQQKKDKEDPKEQQKQPQDEQSQSNGQSDENQPDKQNQSHDGNEQQKQKNENTQKQEKQASQPQNEQEQQSNDESQEKQKQQMEDAQKKLNEQKQNKSDGTRDQMQQDAQKNGQEQSWKDKQKEPGSGMKQQAEQGEAKPAAMAGLKPGEKLDPQEKLLFELLAKADSQNAKALMKSQLQKEAAKDGEKNW